MSNIITIKNNSPLSVLEWNREVECPAPTIASATGKTFLFNDIWYKQFVTLDLETLSELITELTEIKKEMEAFKDGHL